MEQPLYVQSLERAEPLARAHQFASRGLVPLSVVIPGKKPNLLRETLAACSRNAGPCQLELIVVQEDGFQESGPAPEAASSKPNVLWHWIPNERGGNSRNLGAHAARYDHLLFLAEDIQPLDENFFQFHAALHSSRSERNFAVLGGVNYAGWQWSEIAFSPGRFLGGLEPRGCEGPAALSFLDYRYFSWSNISIKKALIRDWNTGGFQADLPGAVGGIEFAYKLSKRLSRALKVFYEPAALALRVGRISLAELMEGQVYGGSMMRTLLDECPGAPVDFGLESYVRALADSSYAKVPAEGDYTRIIEAIKAWARIVDHQAALEGEACRLAFMVAVMEVCFLQGLVRAHSGREVPSAAGALILERFRRRCEQMPLGNFPVPDPARYFGSPVA